MISRESITRVNFLHGRLNDLELGLALLARGGKIAAVEVRLPPVKMPDGTTMEPDDAASVMVEKPYLSVDGIEAALKAYHGEMLAQLAELGVEVAAPDEETVTLTGDVTAGEHAGSASRRP